MRTPGRRCRRFSFAVAALLLTVPACLPTAHCRAVAGPNVLFIAVDDLRCELGCYGVKEIKSPNLDRLAASGVAFTRAYCQQAVCNPSRASLMTGLRPDSTKVWDLDTDMRSTIPDVVTIPQHFRRHGYRAVAFGKIFHGTFPDDVSWDEPTHQAQGVELWPAADRKRLADLKKQMKTDGRKPAAIERMRGPATGMQDLPDDKNFDGKQTTDALAKMRELSEGGSPFFLAVGYIRPHLPFVAPRKYWDLYDRATIPLATNGFLPHGAPAVAFGDRSMGGFYELRDYMDYANAPSPFERPLAEAQQRELKHGYYASVSFIDAQVGRLLDELDHLGLAQNTIVILWGDHGWKLGEHGGWCKQTNYEIDTRAPLMIRAPGAKENGKPSGALVEFVDIYPTLCELCSLPLPGTLEGRSLAPLLRGAVAKVKDAAFSQFPRKHEGRDYMGYAMRTGRYRYIEWLEKASGKIAARELYDHDSDPSENENIAGRPEHAGLLAALNTQMWKALPKPPPVANAAKSPRPRLQILNGSPQPIDIFWLKSDTERLPNGSVLPGKDTIITTTLGHRFEIVGRDDKTTARVTSVVPVQGFRFDPQGRDGVSSFYTQAVSANGFPIVASAKVNPYALKEAAFLVNMMLARRTDVREALIKSGARMCLMAHDEYTTDLPEFVRLSAEKVKGFEGLPGKDYWDARARGLGGSETDPYCSIAEENVLGYPGDPYEKECILIHEFAHNIHLRGLANVDPTFDTRLRAAYSAAMKAGLWKGKYASVNHHEYFAEGVQSWFDNNRVNDHDHNHVHLRSQLIAYDPGLAAICREVFGDTELKYTKPATRLTGHMAGYDPSKAPTFVWPERLKHAKMEIHAQSETRDKSANGEDKRETRNVAGWTVHVSRDLLAGDAKACARALELLQAQLEEIIRVIPKAAVAELQKVPMYFSPEYPGKKPGAEYHPDAGWLREHGRDPIMAKGVEFTNVRVFEAETRRMPNFALHELAHSYHDRFLPQGFGNPEIKAAYEKAKAGGRYDSVERQDSEGRKRMDRAYALTNPQEYFAETTEARFTHNDFFPYTRDQLKQHDPEMFALLTKLWGADEPASGAAPDKK